MDADENAVLVVRLCRIEFNFDDSKWWCSARSVLIDTNHFYGRRPLRAKISAALRETFTYHLESDAEKIRTQSHRDAEAGP